MKIQLFVVEHCQIDLASAMPSHITAIFVLYIYVQFRIAHEQVRSMFFRGCDEKHRDTKGG
jgi:hypothetical protein